jgi:ribosomal protein S1
VLVNEHTLRPGFLVNAKVSKLFENGLEISFLGGMTGTVFADHTDRDSISSFKVGEKVKAHYPFFVKSSCESTTKSFE